jgi:hypothetical protein
MGHSFLKFRGRHEHFRDLDIAIFVRTLLRCVRHDARGRTFLPELDSMFHHWTTPDAFPGPGCIDLALDEFLTTETAVRELLDLIGEAEDRLQDFQDVVPSAWLNAVESPDGPDFVDLPVMRVLAPLKRFRSLLTDGRHF